MKTQYILGYLLGTAMMLIAPFYGHFVSKYLENDSLGLISGIILGLIGDSIAITTVTHHNPPGTGRTP